MHMKPTFQALAETFQDRQRELRDMVINEKLKVARRQRRQELICALIDTVSEPA